MKKTISFLCILLFVLNHNVSFAASLKEAEEIQKMQLELEEELLKEFYKSFELKLDGYEKISIMDLGLLIESDHSLFDLFKISANFYNKGCIGMPLIYLQPLKAVIMVKTKDGKKSIYKFKKVDQNWRVLSEEKR